jgi:hypothetical protein
MSFWGILVPEAGTNLILNPSAELDGYTGTHGSSSLSRSTLYARSGLYHWLVDVSATNAGMTWTVSALANAIHYFSVYVYWGNSGTIYSTLQVSPNNVDWVSATLLNRGLHWARVGFQLPAASCSGSTTLRIRSTGSTDYRLDCALLQQLEYPTTYFDGDSSVFCRWTGLRHLSSSTRSASDRMAGRERDLYDDYGIGVRREFQGAGMPPLSNVRQALGAQEGSSYQGTAVQSRTMVLTLDIEGSSWEGLHSKRADLIDLIRPNATMGNQPFVLVYKGAEDAPRKLYAAFRYEGGMELNGPPGWTETPGFRVAAEDPFWYEDDRITRRESGASTSSSVSNANYVMRRLRSTGVWSALGSGMNAQVNCIAIDERRGRIYFGGTFTTANGVTVNRVCYWDGTTFVAMDSGVNNAVQSIAIAANGDVWVGGSFTTVGSGATACDGLAVWDVSASTWTAVNVATGGSSAIYSMVLDGAGNLYIGGNFTDWNGDADIDYVAMRSAAGTWTQLGTSPFSSTRYPNNHHAMAIDADGNLWSGSGTSGGTSQAILVKWDGSTWTTVAATLGGGGLNDQIYALLFDALGDLYIGGRFTAFASPNAVDAEAIAVYNGSAVAQVGGGLGDPGTGQDVYALAFHDGLLIASGNFTEVADSSLTFGERIAAWNGYTWLHMDVDLPSTPIVYDVVSYRGDLYIGYSSNGSATVSALPNIGGAGLEPVGSADAYPEVTILGSSSSVSTLRYIENVTTGHRLYFNLEIQPEEVMIISFAPGMRGVYSEWTSRPSQSMQYLPDAADFSAPFMGWTNRANVQRITGQPLPGSDLAAFKLLSPLNGYNSIAVYLTSSGNDHVLMFHWPMRHWTADGVAP